MLKAEELRRMVAEATPGTWRDEITDDGYSVDYDSGLDEEPGLSWLAVGPRDQSAVALVVVPSSFGMDDELEANARLIALAPTLATEHAALQDRVARLEAAVTAMLNAVCGPTGFAEAVRHNSGQAFPWHSLDAAEAQARAALAEAAP